MRLSKSVDLNQTLLYQYKTSKLKTFGKQTFQ